MRIEIAGKPPPRKTLSPRGKQRMALAMRAFDAGIVHIGKVFTKELQRDQGTWWPELAPLSREERRRVWQALGAHFEQTKKENKA
jgi:hypothetical protein